MNELQRQIKKNQLELERLQKEIDDMPWIQKWAGPILIVVIGLVGAWFYWMGLSI